MALKSKHESDKLVFEMKIMELQKKLKERDENEQEKGRGKEAETAVSTTTEFSNPVQVLKRRL